MIIDFDSVSFGLSDEIMFITDQSVVFADVEKSCIDIREVSGASTSYLLKPAIRPEAALSEESEIKSEAFPTELEAEVSVLPETAFNDDWIDQYFDFNNICDQDLYLSFSFSFDGLSVDDAQLQTAGFEELGEFFLEKNIFTGRSGNNYDGYQFFYKDGCILGIKEGSPVLLQSESDHYAVSANVVSNIMHELNFNVSKDLTAESNIEVTGNLIFRDADHIDSQIMTNMYIPPLNNESMGELVSGGAHLSFHTPYSFKIAI
ncbi:hypothetical protein GUI12_01915 [Anaplasmataceae bacterium AB001_6]|nr:hypothetical protein GUI12_01915 [Anaplasmataceae bacterium AB001_6]